MDLYDPLIEARAAGTGQKAQAIGKTVQNLAQAGTDIAQKFIQTQSRHEQDKLWNEFQREAADWMQQAPQKAQQLAQQSGQAQPPGEQEASDPSAYLLLDEEFDKFANDWWEKNKDRFTFDRTRDSFKQQLDQYVTEQAVNLKADGYERWAKTVIDEKNELISSATRRGDISSAFDMVNGMLDNGLISAVQADNKKDSIEQSYFYNQNVNQAMQMGLEEGLKYLSNPENWDYRSYDGKERRLGTESQQRAIEQFQSMLEERRIQRKEAHQRRREEQMQAAQQQLWEGTAGFSDLLQLQNETFSDLESQDWRTLKNIYDEILSEREADADGESIQSNPAAVKEYHRMMSDPLVTPQRMKNWMRDQIGPDGLSAKFVSEHLNDADNKSMHENFTAGKERINEVFDELVSQAQSEDDTERVRKLERKRTESLQSYSDEVTRLFQKDQSFLEREKVLDDMADNLIQAQLDDQAINDLQQADLTDRTFGEKLFGDFGDRVTVNNPEQLQKAIQDGDIIGRKDDFRTQLNQLEVGYQRQAAQEIGRTPQFSEQAPDGSILMFYRSNQPSAYTVQNQVLGEPGHFYTYRREGKDLELKIWNGQLGEWQDVPEGVQGSDYWNPTGAGEDTISAKEGGRKSRADQVVDNIRNFLGGGETPQPQSPQQPEATKEDMQETVTEQMDKGTVLQQLSALQERGQVGFLYEQDVKNAINNPGDYSVGELEKLLRNVRNQ
jgi:hypothetical protein